MDDLKLLKQLHDIHLPHPVSIWPLAWGWWVVLALIMLIAFSIYRYNFLINNWFQKRLLMKELILLEANYFKKRNTRQSLDALAFFLKKAALRFYPREQVGSLYGEQWLDFLKLTAKNLDISGCQKLFTQSLYQENIDDDMTQAFKVAKQWLANQRFSCMN